MWSFCIYYAIPTQAATQKESKALHSVPHLFAREETLNNHFPVRIVHPAAATSAKERATHKVKPKLSRTFVKLSEAAIWELSSYVNLGQKKFF